jgi:hypothetical protein
MSPRETKLVKALRQGMTLTDAAIAAGYASETRQLASQSGYQALKHLQRRMPQILDDAGLTEDAVVTKYLIPLLDAVETKFFPFRKTIRQVPKDPKEPTIETVRQEIATRDVVALTARSIALDMYFKLRGSYAPKAIDLDPEKDVPLTINVSAIPSHRELAE